MLGNATDLSISAVPNRWPDLWMTSVKVSKNCNQDEVKQELTVNTTSDPIIAVFVSIHTVTSEVVAFVSTQISLNVSAVISEHSACHAGPKTE